MIRMRLYTMEYNKLRH